MLTITLDVDGSAVSNVESPQIKLRSYQDEMFERSLEGNTIVVVSLIPNVNCC